MSKVFYGIRRLLLLNAASYALGDFPLDRPLSISAPNNRGKSTAINALQFPFLSHMNDMAFPRSNEDTRKYYFPYDNSYVVSEIVTETGTYVVGAVGKGQASGHEYQLFAYHSPLDIEDYLDREQGDEVMKVRNLKELSARLGRRGVWVKPLQPKQMRDALMGKTITLSNDEQFSIGVFRLRSMTDDHYRLFIRVFKNLLHMNNVNLDEMKRLLIDVLMPGEGSTTVDFMSRYRLLNEEVEKALENVDTASRIALYVKKLAEAKVANDKAYGILRALWASIASAYGFEHSRREDAIDRLAKDIAGIEPKMVEIKASRDPLQDVIGEMDFTKRNIESTLTTIEEDAQRFALYESPEVIEQQIAERQEQRDRLVVELQRTDPEDIQGIKADLKSVSQHIEELRARTLAIENNLLFVLTEEFNEIQTQTIIRLFNKDLLSLVRVDDDGIQVVNHEEMIARIRKVLAYCKDGYFDDGSVRIRLDAIPLIDIDDYFNFDSIQQALTRQEKRQSELERNLEVAQDYRRLEQKRRDLQAQIREEEGNLKEYRAYLDMSKNKAQLESNLKQVSADLETKRDELSGMADQLLGLGSHKQDLENQKRSSEYALKELEAKYQQVTPVASSDPLGSAPTHRLPESLEEMIDTYLLAIQSKNESAKEMQGQFDLIESKGGLRFTHSEEEAIRIRELTEAVEGIDEYQLQYENLQKSGSQELGALLKGLSDRFDVFTNEILQFNRQMNKRKISNIERIQFVIDGNNDILNAVKKIVEQGTLFSDPDSVHRAVQDLDRLVGQRGVKLSLENLFNMGISIELENGKVSTSFSDANIQSTGTGLTVKVILNVMLLGRLLYTKEGQVVNIPIYIDEAGQIDPANQQTLIDQCLPAGFVPVFASVEAQATADYCIGLAEKDGRIYVDQEDWFRLEKLEKSQGAQASA